MKLARQLEQRMEHLVEGLSANVFRGQIHPVELADRLVRHIDRQVSHTTIDPAIANTYLIRVHSDEIPDAVDRNDLQRELALVVFGTAVDRGWRIGGPTSVRVLPAENVSRGRVEIEGRSEPGPLALWAQLIDPQEGKIHDLTDNRVNVGRSPTEDVVIGDSKVSRHHAVIFREGGRMWLADAGSANGTLHNNKAVRATAAIETGDTITFGPATFTFKAL